MTEEELIDVFTKLGSPNPELWAEAHLKNGNQLGCFLLLRGLWRTAANSKSTKWIDDALENAPESELMDLIKIVLNAGITKKQLARLTRLSQAESLAQVAYMLDDPSVAQNDFCRISGKEYVPWGVFLMDEESMRPTYTQLGSLYGDFDNVDPEKNPGSSPDACGV